MFKSLVTLSLAAAASAAGLNGYWVRICEMQCKSQWLTHNRVKLVPNH